MTARDSPARKPRLSSGSQEDDESKNRGYQIIIKDLNKENAALSDKVKMLEEDIGLLKEEVKLLEETQDLGGAASGSSVICAPLTSAASR